LAWYELDINYLGIRALEALGLAWDVKVAKLDQDLEEEAA
jgi:fatty-acid desaturase